MKDLKQAWPTEDLYNKISFFVSKNTFWDIKQNKKSLKTRNITVFFTMFFLIEKCPKSKIT